MQVSLTCSRVRMWVRKHKPWSYNDLCFFKHQTASFLSMMVVRVNISSTFQRKKKTQTETEMQRVQQAEQIHHCLTEWVDPVLLLGYTHDDSRHGVMV